jgi:hypothetical protein
MIIFYFGLVLFLSVFLSERNKPFEDGLAVAVFYGGYLTFIGAILFALKDVSVSLSINNNEVIYRKWVYLFIKTERIALLDVEKLDVVTSITSGAKLIFVLKNGDKKQVGLFYFKEVIGEIKGVILGKYAPNNPKLKLGVDIAKTISMNSYVKFNTVYLEESSIE